MTVPMYVPPVQWMGDRREFARQGAHAGPGAALCRYNGGIVMVVDNPGPTLHRIGEIHDRIALVGAGRHSEYELLRIAGIRAADLRAYTYDRLDVTGRGMATTYSQLLGSAFSRPSDKPFEVELAVAELGRVASEDHFYTVTWDGTITEGDAPVLLGGVEAGGRSEQLSELADQPSSLPRSVRILAELLTAEATPDPARLEVCVLDHHCRRRRTFRRLDGGDVASFWNREQA